MIVVSAFFDELKYLSLRLRLVLQKLYGEYSYGMETTSMDLTTALQTQMPAHTLTVWFVEHRTDVRQWHSIRSLSTFLRPPHCCAITNPKLRARDHLIPILRRSESFSFGSIQRSWMLCMIFLYAHLKSTPLSARSGCTHLSSYMVFSLGQEVYRNQNGHCLVDPDRLVWHLWRSRSHNIK